MSLIHLRSIAAQCDRVLEAKQIKIFTHDGYNQDEWNLIKPEIYELATRRGLVVTIFKENITLKIKGDTTPKEDRDRVVIEFDSHGQYVTYWLSNRISENPCSVNNIKELEDELLKKNFFRQPPE